MFKYLLNSFKKEEICEDFTAISSEYNLAFTPEIPTLKESLDSRTAFSKYKLLFSKKPINKSKLTYKISLAN